MWSTVKAKPNGHSRHGVVSEMATPSRTDPTVTSSRPTLQRYIDAGAQWATRHERVLWTLALTVLVLDVVTTAYGLQVGLVEQNPFVNQLLPVVGLFGTFVLLKGFAVAVAVTAWWLMPEHVRGIVPLGLTIPWAVAATSNTVLLASVLL